MANTVIIGDIIASTSLPFSERAYISKSLKYLLKDLKLNFDIYGRFFKGDFLECFVPEPADALRVALIIKSFVKSLRSDDLTDKVKNKRSRLYSTYRIRLAIGYGELNRIEPRRGIIDGEALYLAGRKINEMSTYKGERIVIKNTLFFVSKNEKMNKEFDALFSLLDVLLAKATSKQSEVLYLKLMNFNEEQISEKIRISQQTVNQHSRSIGWNAIEKAVEQFNSVLKNN
jgi:hypothetical protein